MMEFVMILLPLGVSLATTSGMNGIKLCNYFTINDLNCDVTDDVILQKSADLTDCCLACISHALCNGISYLQTGSTCKLHSSCPKECNGSTTPGWRALCKEKKICTEFGRRCEEEDFTFVDTLSMCYKIFRDVANYTEAQRHCSVLGGRLLRVDSLDKESYMEHELSQLPDYPTKYFIDGRFDTDQFYFANGDRITEFFWYTDANYEGKECLGIHAVKRGWKDVLCTGYHGYICEKYQQ